MVGTNQAAVLIENMPHLQFQFVVVTGTVYLMKLKMPQLLFFCAPTLIGCGTGTWVAELAVDTDVRTALETNAFNDGCTLMIDALPIVLLDTSVSNASGFVYGLSEFDNTLFDASVDSPIRLWDAELTALLYTAQHLHVRPGLATVLHESIDPEYGRSFDANNGSIGLKGTLTCEDLSVTLDWAFSTSHQFSCDTKLKITEDIETKTTFLVDPSQWFRQSTVEDGSDALLGQAIASADSNDNGMISLNELQAIPLNTLDGYDDDPEDRIETLYDHIEANTTRALKVGDQRCASM